jgi:hypothetical protein
MSEGEVPERPSGALTIEQANPRDQAPLVSFMEKKVYDELSRTPAGEDPAFWPIHVLNEMNYYVTTRHEMSGDLPPFIRPVAMLGLPTEVDHAPPPGPQ